MIINGDCLEVMRSYEDNHFSGIVTDPPYMLNFMGKAFDKFKDNPAANIDVWKGALRVCKPGSQLLAFGGDRTHHHMMKAIEDAGWEIRTCIYWIFGSGFPKSHNFGRKIGGDWQGYGTALKPAAEIIVLAMKPLEGTFLENASKWGVAGLNIDASRIETQDNLNGGSYGHSDRTFDKFGFGKVPGGAGEFTQPKGRWPSNLLLDESAAQQLDQMTGVSKSTIRPPTPGIKKSQGRYGDYNDSGYPRGVTDSGGASRFFYCAKASSSERNEGLGDLPLRETGVKNDSGRGFSESDPYAKRLAQNNHPTVKPLRLMQYLLRLIAPPSGGIILDPFAGSGSTCVAAKRLGIDCIGIEKSAEYCEIANARIAA